MKKIVFTLIAILSVVTLSAQQIWDFTQTNEDDIQELNGATAEWTYDEANDRFQSVNAVSGPLTAGGKELLTTKGLLFEASAKKIRIDVNKRVQLAGKNIQVTIPLLKKGQTVTLVFASTGSTAVTFDARTNFSETQGFIASDKETIQTATGTVTADGDVTFKSTGGSINMFSITVSEAGNDTDEPERPVDMVNGSVLRNTNVNQALFTLSNGDVKYYNTADVSSIDFVDNQVQVAMKNQSKDVYHGTVTRLSFQKKDEQGQPVVIDNGCVEITEAKGWLESLYVKWHLCPGAVDYSVYVVGGQYPDWTRIDPQLVRNYGTYGRADVVGLKAGSYDVKVEPVFSEGSDMPSCGPSYAKGLKVMNYDRTGFAHFNYNSGVGAYNNDGSLKAAAKVFYVTANTAKTISTEVITSSKGGKTLCTGLQTIIDAYQKGYDTTPLAFRFVGLVSKNDLDAISSSEEGLQVKGKNADSELNITFEGIGDDATIKGFGFLVRNAKSVEFRNLGIMRCMDDGISLDTDNSNIWIHHTDVFYGPNGGGDHAKGDGATDVKTNSKYVTVAYNRYWDTGKTNMFGMKSESGPNYISYHHNWFDHSDSRHPRVRTMTVHVWNNYFDNVAKYGVGATTGSSVFVENNYFLKTKKPILSSKQGTDAMGSGTFSGEDGGMIKAFGNYFDRTIKNFSYYTQNSPANTGYDAYETATRDEQVPASEVTRAGGTNYSNFDTNSSLIYPYSPDAAADVPNVVTGYYGAGRLNHGDFTYTFADNVGNDDADSAYDSTLGSLLDNYKSPLVGFFGNNEPGGEQGGGEQGGGEQGGGEQGGEGGEVTPQPEGTIFCTFDKNGTPSNSFFTVSGNGSNSKGTATIDGQSYTTCLKMEKATSIKFTITTSMSMTLYFADTETASIKINGEKIAGTGSTYTTVLAPDSYELTKDKSVNLFAIKLEPVE